MVKNGSKYILINYYFKCQWAKGSKQKTQHGRLDKRNKNLQYAAYKRFTLGQKTQTESGGMEKGYLSKGK